MCGAPLHYGHGANSQLGPVLPTDVPSGQILASCVQAFEVGVGLADTENTTGTSKFFEFEGSPLGLSFCRIKKPDTEDVLKVRVAVKSTGLPFCQLPATVSLACP